MSWRSTSALPLGMLALLAAACAAPRPVPLGSRCIVLEDFAKGPPGAFPADWVVREEPGTSVYTVQVTDGRAFLRARARGLGIQAGKPREWDLAEYPVLAWKWRPRVFPKGGNEQAGPNDSVLAVYAVFPYAEVGVKAVESVKYVWSEHVRRGTHLESSAGHTQVLVLRTGVPADRGAWVQERVNVVEDFRRFFRQEVRRPAGIAVLTDSDDTRSYAEGDYTDFRACPAPR